MASGVVVAVDPRDGPEHVAERASGGLSVRQVPPADHPGRGERFEELADEPALPDAGRTTHEDPSRRAVGEGAANAATQVVELPGAPDERRARHDRRVVGRRTDFEEPERRQGLGLALGHERRDGLGADVRTGQLARHGVEQDLPGRRVLLEARRDVDGVAEDEPLTETGVAGDDLSRVDADAVLHRRAPPRGAPR